MRRLLAFITIAMLALAANAQQSPTNTDAVRSKLTMRGYKAFYDVNYLFTIYPSDTDTGNSLGFSTSHGFQFNNHLYFGGGIGFNSFFCDGTTRLVVPIFGELRCNFLNRRTTPFVCGRYGYGFGKIHGSYDSLVLGMRLALKNNQPLANRRRRVQCSIRHRRQWLLPDQHRLPSGLRILTNPTDTEGHKRIAAPLFFLSR